MEDKFSVRSVPGLCNEDMGPLGLRTKNHCDGEGQQKFSSQSVSSQLLVARVEEGPNTSTVALRVVGGYEKGTQCLGL
jgi:hypothetical protein